MQTYAEAERNCCMIINSCYMVREKLNSPDESEGISNTLIKILETGNLNVKITLDELVQCAMEFTNSKVFEEFNRLIDLLKREIEINRNVIKNAKEKNKDVANYKSLNDEFCKLFKEFINRKNYDNHYLIQLCGELDKFKAKLSDVIDDLKWRETDNSNFREALERLRTFQKYAEIEFKVKEMQTIVSVEIDSLRLFVGRSVIAAEEVIVLSKDFSFHSLTDAKKKLLKSYAGGVLLSLDRSIEIAKMLKSYNIAQHWKLKDVEEVHAELVDTLHGI